MHLDQNVLGLLRRDSLGLDSGPLGWPLFRCRTARSAPVLLFGRKRGTRKSRLETKTENEASSVPWCTTPIEAESSLGPDSHHPIISLSGIPSAVMVLRILHPILASTLCAANPLARIAEPTIAL